MRKKTILVDFDGVLHSYTIEGVFPTLEEIGSFKPWNKRGV